MTLPSPDVSEADRMRLGAEAAERLILRLRSKAFDLLRPDVDQSAGFADLVGELETAPEIADLRAALGRTDPLPPPIVIESGD